MVAGVMYEITLDDVETRDDALLELARFRADPAGYRPAAQELAEREAAAVRLDPRRVDGFLDYLEKGGRTPGYRADVTTYLADWAEVLAGRDLRSLDGKAVRKLLADWPAARKHRIIAFKSFCSWLVDEGELDPAANPGRWLTVPSDRRTHELKAHSLEAVEKLYSVLPTQYVRDVLCLQAKTGMHGTEVARLAGGLGTLREVEDCAPIAGTIAFKHKTGALHVVSLDAQTLAAAQRLIVVGRAPSRHTIHEAVDLAAEKNKGKGVVALDFGALRHSFATWAHERGEEFRPKGVGVPLEKVAERLGHTNTRTTRLHYLDVSVPPMIIIPIRLCHPDDPPLPVRAAARTGSRRR